MPKYNFECDKCDNMDIAFMSIHEFIKDKTKNKKCKNCQNGVLYHKIVDINSVIEKSKDQILIESEEEVRKTVDKVRVGDRKAIRDIYGDKPNPYKNKGVI